MDSLGQSCFPTPTFFGKKDNFQLEQTAHLTQNETKAQAYQENIYKL
jgi:hypothetical protein